MSQYQIAVMVGSLRRESINRKLANAVAKLAPADFALTTLRIDDIPPFNQDDEMNPTEPVKRLKKEIQASQGVIFVTAEYNRSIPGVLKNAIDQASRPYGKSAWDGKPAGILGASIGAIGTAVAQQHLRSTLAYLNMPTLGQPEVFVTVKDDTFDAAGGIASAGTKKFLQGWVDRYVQWVKKHAG